MRGLKTLIRLHRWQLDETRRKLDDLEHLRVGLETQSRRLEAELHDEQNHATRSLEGGYAYPGFAEAVIGRRQTIAHSMVDVEASIEQTHEELTAAIEKLKTYEIADQRELERSRVIAARRERLELDDVAMQVHRRGRQQIV